MMKITLFFSSLLLLATTSCAKTNSESTRHEPVFSFGEKIHGEWIGSGRSAFTGRCEEVLLLISSENIEVSNSTIELKMTAKCGAQSFIFPNEKLRLAKGLVYREQDKIGEFSDRGIWYRRTLPGFEDRLFEIRIDSIEWDHPNYPDSGIYIRVYDLSTEEKSIGFLALLVPQ